VCVCVCVSQALGRAATEDTLAVHSAAVYLTLLLLLPLPCCQCPLAMRTPLRASDIFVMFDQVINHVGYGDFATFAPFNASSDFHDCDGACVPAVCRGGGEAACGTLHM
jgi:hypothetical protein